MATITPAALQKLLSSQPETALIDVRTSAEFSQVHVPGARNLPFGQFHAPEVGVAKDQPLYILCQAGGRAKKAADQLTTEGLERAIVVEGGTQAWIDAGLPVERGGGKVISLERQVRIAAGSLVLIGIVLGSLVNPALYGLSAFVGVGLVFAGITDFCGMGLLLARMPWNTRSS